MASRGWRLTLVVCLIGTSLGCAHKPPTSQGVSIDKRPTPTPVPAPVASSTGSGATASPPPVVTPEKTPPAEAVMSADERKSTLARIVADTTAASAAVSHCATKNLLPDQESVFDTTRSYLIQARAALQRDELWQAESLARKARQLALSLECH
jgi:hypothetical protein